MSEYPKMEYFGGNPLTEWTTMTWPIGPRIHPVIILLTLLTVLVAVLSGVGQGAPSSGPRTPAFPSPPVQSSETRCVPDNASPAETMASLETGHSCPRVLLINRFRTLLTRIAGRCQNTTPKDAADFMVVGRRLIQEKGVAVGYLELTEALAKLTNGETNLNCDRVFSQYVILVTQG